ncbi:MAG: hypothetical protein ACLP3C_15675 [Mycobacterium sp.]|uniref:hypothetical protein n=1 Tax=Mycobacterium sp. TaxID=1785 RepID=UPI003F9E74A2
MTPRWGDGLTGERLPGYQILVTEHGSTKRHRFVLDPDTEDEPGGPHWRWYAGKPPARGAFTERGQRWWGAPRRPLPAITDLAKGVDVPGPTLEVVFDALVSGRRHRIDLADIKRIVSQLGSRIARLDTLAADQRRLVEPALYTEILARCISM